MAERRMFAKTIVTSDAFLDMPMSARCLYFTLGMFADDEGFVNNPKSIMRQIGATADDMNVLIAKKFILTFESGVVVIKHWRIHNYIQSDRFHPTKYVEERKQLFVNDKKAYSKKDGETVEIPTMYPDCIQDVSKVDTEVSIGKDRLGKDRLGEDIYSPADAEHGDTVSIPYPCPTDTPYTNTVKEIVDYLNEMCGTSYKATTRKTADLIKARMNEGFTVEDFKTVIYKKAKQWKDDEKMVKFLRPVTLFSPKFESYLNEKERGGRLDWLDEI